MMEYRLYNPALLSDEQLKQSFVARNRQLQQLTRFVREQPSEGALRHVIIIGPRGMGKTTLGLRLLLEVRRDPELSNAWQPVPFFEESYGVTDLPGFWLTACRHLADATGERRWEVEAAELLDRERSSERLEAEALGLLVDFCRERRKRLILFVENLDTLFAQFLTPDHAFRLRATLQERSEVLLIGTANSVFSQITEHNEPFYEFFLLVRLGGLSQSETKTYAGQLATDLHNEALEQTLKKDPGRLEVIRRFTGGNPRLINLAARMIAESPMGAARDDLERLIDEQTPYFKARIEQLPPQTRAIFHVLAAGWRPMLAREVAKQARLSSSQASAQLRKLQQLGYVETIPGRTERARYQVSERFYNIYYLLRFTRDQRTRLEHLIEFVTQLFGAAAATGMARAILTRLKDLKGIVTDEWAAMGALASHLQVDSGDPESRKIILDALQISNELQAELPEDMLDHAFTVAKDDVAVLSEQYVDAARRYLSTHSNNASVRAAIGIALAKCEKFDEAYAELTRFIEGGGEDALIMVIRGIVLKELGRDKDAESDLLAALEIKPEWDGAKETLGRFYLSIGRIDEAQTRLRDALRNREANGDTWAIYSVALDRGGHPKDAETAARRAIALDAESAFAWGSLGHSLFVQNRLVEAEQALRQTIELDKADARAWYGLSAISEKVGKMVEAESALRSAVTNSPSAWSWAQLGKFYEKTGRFRDAEEAFRSGIECEVKQATPYVGLSRLMLSRDQLDEAECILNEAIKVDKTDSEAHIMMAYVLAKKDRKSEGLDHLKMAEQAADAGDLATIALLLATTYADRDAAVRMIEIAMERMPEEAVMHQAAAILFTITEDYEEALHHLNRSLIIREEVLENSDISFISTILIGGVAAGLSDDVLKIINERHLDGLLEPLVQAIKEEEEARIEPLPAEIAEAVSEVRNRIAHWTKIDKRVDFVPYVKPTVAESEQPSEKALTEQET
jgi:tetratricopeptide (TPR) repeat protein